MFGKYNGFVSKARVSAYMYFLVVYNNSIYIGVWEGEGRGIGYPQIVGQSRPFGQYSLHSRAILLLKLIGEILSILGGKYKVIINYNTFRFLFVVTPPLSACTKTFFDKSGTMRKNRANLFRSP